MSFLCCFSVDDLRAQQILVPSNSLTKEANAQLPKLMLTSPSKIKKENEIPSPKPHTQTQSQTRSVSDEASVIK